jgi:hypothetical protein
MKSTSNQHRLAIFQISRDYQPARNYFVFVTRIVSAHENDPKTTNITNYERTHFNPILINDERRRVQSNENNVVYSSSPSNHSYSSNSTSLSLIHSFQLQVSASLETTNSEINQNIQKLVKIQQINHVLDANY